jgi:nicotinamidase-related amidase
MKQDNTVLLAIDMQNDFYNRNWLERHPKGCKEHAQHTLQKVIGISQRVLQWARQNELPVIWTYEIHRQNLSDIGLELDWEGKHALENTAGAELIEEMQALVEADDIHIKDKRRWDAFFGTDLEIVLKGLKSEHVIFIGAEAAACVLSTVLAAKMRDYRITIVKDAILGLNPDRLNAMEVICQSFADIIDSRGLAS